MYSCAVQAPLRGVEDAGGGLRGEAEQGELVADAVELPHADAGAAQAREDDVDDRRLRLGDAPRARRTTRRGAPAGAPNPRLAASCGQVSVKPIGARASRGTLGYAAPSAFAARSRDAESRRHRREPAPAPGRLPARPLRPRRHAHRRGPARRRGDDPAVDAGAERLSCTPPACCCSPTPPPATRASRTCPRGRRTSPRSS